jgi:hypothetical protein
MDQQHNKAAVKDLDLRLIPEKNLHLMYRRMVAGNPQVMERDGWLLHTNIMIHH